MLRISKLARFGNQVRCLSTQASIPERIDALERDWATNPRWESTKREYSAEDVVRLQGEMMYEETFATSQCDKLWNRLKTHQANGTASVTFGALDPVQAVEMAHHADSIYVSGWQCAVSASSTRESGPDLADYPYDTVPKKVDQIVRALRYHDRKQFSSKYDEIKAGTATNLVDYKVPIIADADTGHGGVSAVMRLTKLFAEAGASGMHIEDQRPGSKKCGHMGGKVLVSTREHAERLQAARLQSDIMGVPMHLVGRTDAEAASLLDSDSDVRDHSFIAGTVPGSQDFVTMQEAAEQASPEIANNAEWQARAGNMSHDEMRQFYQSTTGQSLQWAPARTIEGFYHIKPCVQMCVERANNISGYADLLWMETAKPGLTQAGQFAEGVNGNRDVKKLLAYNLSPSFNWDNSGMSDAEIEDFCKGLGRLGFAWQFITLAGFHGSGLVANRLARSFIKDKNMLAYVSNIQRAEREEGVPLLTHQTWSGAELSDLENTTVKGNAAGATNILGAGNTESQF